MHSAFLPQARTRQRYPLLHFFQHSAESLRHDNRQENKSKGMQIINKSCNIQIIWLSIIPRHLLKKVTQVVIVSSISLWIQGKYA